MLHRAYLGGRSELPSSCVVPLVNNVLWKQAAEVHNGPCQKLFGVGCSERAADAISSLNHATQITLQCPDQLLLSIQPRCHSLVQGTHSVVQGTHSVVHSAVQVADGLQDFIDLGHCSS